MHYHSLQTDAPQGFLAGAISNMWLSTSLGFGKVRLARSHARNGMNHTCRR
jgi:hypothetical protein